MPDRYVSDTSSKCMTLTQSRWVTTWVDSCYNLSDLIWKQDTSGGAIAVGTTGNGMEIDAPRVNSSVSFALDVEPAVEQLLTFEIASLTAGTGSMIAVEESIGGQWKTLNSVALNKTGLITLSFVPLGNGVKVSVTGPTKVILNRICRKKPIQYQESYLTQVFNGDKDRYRFGFNGQEKVNEIAGAGNYLDFTFRGYDPRTGRFWSSDPLHRQYPWNSTYAFAENDVIRAIDLEGLEKYIIIYQKYQQTDAKLSVVQVPEKERVNPNAFAYFVNLQLEKGDDLRYSKHYSLANSRGRESVLNSGKGQFVNETSVPEHVTKSTVGLAKIEGEAWNQWIIPSVIVRFDADKTDFKGNLKDYQKTRLSDLNNMIKAGVINGLKVTGHTSEISTKYKSSEVNAENNLQLSIDRAQAGTDYLINEVGVDASKIETEGVGSSQPAGGKSPDDPSNQRTIIMPTGTQ